jgi:putative metalloprotease
MTAILWLVVLTVVLGLVNMQVSLWRMRRELDAKALPLNDPDLARTIVRLGEAAGLPGLRAHLYDMPVVNGLATPDGRILITTALYDKYRLGALKAEEIASVIAHELGHVALGHHRRRMIDYTGQNAARLVLALLLNRFIPIVGILIANWLGNLLLAGLSRRDEFEADRYATALMIRAGFGHRPQISMFRKLMRMVPGPQGPAWMLSHPDVEDRVRAIEANAAAWGETVDAPDPRALPPVEPGGPRA